MFSVKSLLSAVLAVALATVAAAADAVGSWTAKIDTPIGLWSYTYTFTKEGDLYSGTAILVFQNQQQKLPLTELKVEGDQISFLENPSIEGGEIPVYYSGKIVGDEIQFSREVGTFATETFTAKRVKADAAKK